MNTDLSQWWNYEHYCTRCIGTGEALPGVWPAGTQYCVVCGGSGRMPGQRGEGSRVLSIRQPWAWLIIRPDLTGRGRERWMTSRFRKGIENRPRRLSYRGQIYIHAGLAIDHAALAYQKENFGFHIPFPDKFETGGIIGRVDMTDCVSASPSYWFRGPFGYVFERPEALPFEPIPGILGLFRAGPPPSNIPLPPH